MSKNPSTESNPPTQPMHIFIPHSSNTPTQPLSIEYHTAQLKTATSCTNEPATTPPTHSITNPMCQEQTVTQSRTCLIQGERLGVYIIISKELQQQYGWLKRLVWGEKLREKLRDQSVTNKQHPSSINEDDHASDHSSVHEMAADELVLQPCPLSIRLSLRPATQDESEEYQLAHSLKSNQNWPSGVETTNVTDHQDDISSDSTSDDEKEEVADVEADKVKEDGSSNLATNPTTDSASAAAIDIESTPTRSDPLRPDDSITTSAAATTALSPSSVTPSVTASHLTRSPLLRSSSGSVAGSNRFAWRNSFTPSSTFSATPADHLHHPSRLAPGYAPAYSISHRTQGGSSLDEKQSHPVWSHTQSDSHQAPGLCEEATEATNCWYFYLPDEEHEQSDNKLTTIGLMTESTAITTETAAASTISYGTLVLFIETTLSILPHYLTHSPTTPHLLAFEVELLSPPASHHTSLKQSTMTLQNSSQFMIDANGHEGVGKNGYQNLRAFVSANRALQVPHSIPPGRLFVTVVDPLQISSKSIYLGSDVGLPAEEDGSRIPDGLSGGCDIAIEFTLKNITNDMTLQVTNLDFLLNRSRIFLKISSATTTTASPTNPSTSSNTMNTPFAPASTNSTAAIVAQALAAAAPIPHNNSLTHPKDHRSSVHYVPLSQFFQSTMDKSVFPIQLGPLEQFNLLCFLTAPKRQKLHELELLLREFLSQSGSQSSSAFSLSSTALPFRTPFTVEYYVVGVGSQGQRIVTQNKTIWRSQNASLNSATTGPSTHISNHLTSSASSSSTTIILSSGVGGSTSTNLKLSLRVKVVSPVPVHQNFPVFITLTNHSSTQVTPNLQLVILPHSHPIVLEARKLQRQEPTSYAAPADEMDAKTLSVTNPSNHEEHHRHPSIFSSVSPAPPLLFSPNPLNVASSSASPFASPRSTDMSFPFHSFHSRTSQTKSRSSGNDGQRDRMFEEEKETPSMPSTINDTTRSNSHEVLTTTLSHFLSGDETKDGQLPSTSNYLAHTSSNNQRDRQFVLPFAKIDSNHHVSSLICFETVLPVPSLSPQCDWSSSLHYLAVREGQLPLDTIFIYEPNTREYYRPTQTPTIYAVATTVTKQQQQRLTEL